MSKNPIIFFSFFILGFALTSGGVQAQTQSPTPKYPYPQTVITEYLASCQQRSLTEGLSQQDTDKLCTCTVNQFQNLYSVEQFKKLREEAKNNQQAADELSEVGYTCLDQILYEEPTK